MKKIKIKTPAKINLVLEILGKRPDGFHEIQSIMQTVSLFDYLTITVGNNDEELIGISGNSPLIPYNEDNIAFKAAKRFLQKAKIRNQAINIYIEKNIPIAAGLAGGSSNAAGVLWGMNKLCDNPLTTEELHFIASSLGSDVNFCLQGGTCAATSRGEIIQPLASPDLKILIVKPKNVFISAKEAYNKYSKLPVKPETGIFEQMKKAVAENNTDKIAPLLNNNLEKAIIPAYPEIEKAKEYLINCGCINAVMSGSGSAVFGIYINDIDINPVPEGYEIFKAVSISYDYR